MITLRPGGDRGRSKIDWLDSYHTFSFNHFYDPDYTGFRDLRVINEDFIKPGEGFGAHPHRDMEILTWVLAGRLEHKDSTGGGGVIGPGEIQRMTAGTGVTHSEFNHSQTEPVHLYQIWILPEESALTPGYEQKKFDLDAARGRWTVLASRDGIDGAVKINQDARLLVARLGAEQEIAYDNLQGRHAWVQVARGGVTLNDQSMKAGDGAAISGEETLALRATSDAEILLFDLS